MQSSQDLVTFDWIEILEKIRHSATSESGKEGIIATVPLKSEQEAYKSFQ